MLPDMNVPVHWPKMCGEPDDHTPQAAIRALNVVRALIVKYRREQDGDWRVNHAQSAPICDVVSGLIADATAIDELHEAADAEAERLGKENERLREELEEAKRPFTAQMTMLNRRIIDLNEKLLMAEMKLEQKP